jgi:hypothetical protein
MERICFYDDFSYVTLFYSFHRLVCRETPTEFLGRHEVQCSLLPPDESGGYAKGTLTEFLKKPCARTAQTGMRSARMPLQACRAFCMLYPPPDESGVMQRELLQSF